MLKPSSAPVLVDTHWYCLRVPVPSSRTIAAILSLEDATNRSAAMLVTPVMLLSLSVMVTLRVVLLRSLNVGATDAML